jgi:alkanesulfonate monooxygenase SsuD/methylene tetrahydromethanopterin reductase-like flavin-dependent oxidoreductase (luciferase family)
MNDELRLGVLLPTGQALWGEGTDPRELIAFAVRAERLGFDSLWVNDSLLTPRIEALTMLAALTPVTERVTLGTAALLPALRRPVPAAQAVASLDLLSGGRLVLAVGAGFPGRYGRPVYALAEVPWQRRFARLDDTVALWRQLWSGQGPSSFHGEVLHFDELGPSTMPYRPGGPPIWLGGATPAALDRTGRHYDGWLPYPPEPTAYQMGLADVRQAASRAGRDPAAITPALFVTVLIADDEERGRHALDEYSRVTYDAPLEVIETIQIMITGTRERVAAQLDRFVVAGARHIVCRIGALGLKSQLDQLEQLGVFPTPDRPASSIDCRLSGPLRSRLIGGDRSV